MVQPPFHGGYRGCEILLRERQLPGEVSVRLVMNRPACHDRWVAGSSPQSARHISKPTSLDFGLLLKNSSTSFLGSSSENACSFEITVIRQIQNRRFFQSAKAS